MRLTQEQREEGRRLLAAMTPGDWGFGDGAIHSEDETGGAWVPSYTDNMGELNEKALADGLAIEWLIRNRDTLLSETEPIDTEAIKREAVREFARKVASKFGANAQSWSVLANVDSLPAGRELALARSDLWLAAADEVIVAARGVNLDEKP